MENSLFRVSHVIQILVVHFGCCEKYLRVSSLDEAKKSCIIPPPPSPLALPYAKPAQPFVVSVVLDSVRQTLQPTRAGLF